MDLWSHDRFTFPLPATHRFPLTKYARLRARLEADGIARPDEIHECEPVPWDWIEAVQQPRARRAPARGHAVGARAARARAAVVGGARRARAAHDRRHRRRRAPRPARGVGMNLGGGTHHAGYDFARGYCLFNDVAVALARVRADGGARRALVVDCDVHQGDGTAQVLAGDPEAFTLSLHGARNYPFQRIPSDLDVDLADRDRRPRLPAGARRRPRRRAAPRAAPTSPSTSPAPTRSRATASDAWPSPRPACGHATSWSSSACAARAPPSSSSSPAATPATSTTRSTSTRRPRPSWPRPTR